MKKFKTQIYFSGYYTFEIEAKNEEEAISQARNLVVTKSEILSNLENWHEADNAVAIEKPLVKKQDI